MEFGSPAELKSEKKIHPRGAASRRPG